MHTFSLYTTRSGSNLTTNPNGPHTRDPLNYSGPYVLHPSEWAVMSWFLKEWNFLAIDEGIRIMR